MLVRCACYCHLQQVVQAGMNASQQICIQLAYLIRYAPMTLQHLLSFLQDDIVMEPSNHNFLLQSYA